MDGKGYRRGWDGIVKIIGEGLDPREHPEITAGRVAGVGNCLPDFACPPREFPGRPRKGAKTELKRSLVGNP